MDVKSGKSTEKKVIGAEGVESKIERKRNEVDGEKELIPESR